MRTSIARAKQLMALVLNGTPLQVFNPATVRFEDIEGDSVVLAVVDGRAEALHFREKPPMAKFGCYEVPMALTSAPLRETQVFMPSIDGEAISYFWTGSARDLEYLKAGILYGSPTDAKQVATVLVHMFAEALKS